jgi:hypothetical protein
LLAESNIGMSGSPTLTWIMIYDDTGELFGWAALSGVINCENQSHGVMR